MNDNKKYSIREYRERLYEDIAKRLIIIIIIIFFMNFERKKE